VYEKFREDPLKMRP